MLAPLAFPGAILGISLVIAYARRPFSLSGTLLILLIAYTIGTLPLAFTYQRAGLKQIDQSMEEAARSLGATWSKTVRKITLPLLRGPVLVVAVLTFIVHLRDLDSSMFLFNGNNPVIGVVLMNILESGHFQQISALSIMLLTINLVILGLALAFYRVSRRGARPTIPTH
jgi:iron(III) transport system permease protein